MKIWNERIKGFIIGVAITVIMIGTVIPTMAEATSRIESIKVAYSGIKMYVDGKLVIPTDGNGKIVEPFVHDGTTYLPVRALSNALTNNEKNVSWDAATQSIYIGKAPVAEQTDISKYELYHSELLAEVLTGEEASFKILNNTFTPFNRLNNNSYGLNQSKYTYILDSNFSSISGQFAVSYTSLGDKSWCKIKFYTLDSKGNQTLLKEYIANAGDEIINIEVNLVGVNILKIEYYGCEEGAFYNVLLHGVY